MEIVLLYTRIPKGYYANVAELITTINQEIQDSLSGRPEWTQKREQKKEVNLIYRYNPIEHVVEGFQPGMVDLP